MSGVEGTVCRCCLRGGSATVSVFSRHKSSVLYAEMLRECCSIDVNPDVKLSRVCPKCTRKLKSSYKFRKMCQKINQIITTQPRVCIEVNTICNLKNNIDIGNIDTAEKHNGITTNDTVNNNMNNYYETVKEEIKSERDALTDKDVYELVSENVDKSMENVININNYHETVKEEIKTERDALTSEDVYELVSETDNKSMKNEILNSEDVKESLKLDTSDDDSLLIDLMESAETQSATDGESVVISRPELNTENSNCVIVTKPPKKKGKNVCHLCNIDCKHSQRLVDHVNWVHKGVKYFCELCQKHYTSKMVHIKNTHTEGKQCALCGLVLKTKTKYYTHMHTQHRGGGPHECEQCGTVCSSKAGLDRHRREHGGTKYICQYCSRSFRRRDKLNDHIKVHTKERPFACAVCPYRFPSRHLLNRHTLRHTALKTIKCDHCDAMFKTKSDLRQHITRHDEGAKRYACAVCGKRFRRSDHRNAHQTNVHRLGSPRCHTLEL